jgi:protein SCO1/2
MDRVLKEEALGEYSFRLMDASGRFVTNQDFLGRVRLVFFGFTHCPDICPLGLTKMSEVLDGLGKDRKKVAPIFITVDPERDTPDKMKIFLENFPHDFIGLTGSQEEISSIVASYKAYAHKQPLSPQEGYGISHSSFIYIMDSKGVYRTHVQLDADVETITAQIRKNLS